jgi:hypothetical protein
MLGRVGIEPQSIMYSPPMIGVPPSSLLIWVTASEGPAIREVPVSAIALKRERDKNDLFEFDPGPKENQRVTGYVVFFAVKGWLC